MTVDNNGEFSNWVERVNSENARGEYRLVGAVAQSWITATQAAGIVLASTDIIIRDSDVKHGLRESKNHEIRLPLAWYKEIPKHLTNPQAVLLDKTIENQATFCLLYPIKGEGQRFYKLVVRINYLAKLNREKQITNVLETGHIVNAVGIKGQIGTRMVLIEGEL